MTTGKLGIAAMVAAACGLSAMATAFPDPVGGVVTLEVASGSVTYDSALGNVTKLVKKGAGEAVLSAATTAFTGSVDVQGGTLRITHGNALGTGKPITVSDGATFHLNANDPKNTTGGACQTSYWFHGHDLTICGQGVNGQGAFRFNAPTWQMYDKAIDTLTLTGDATIRLEQRIGFNSAINLNGHTLTRTASASGDTWMMSSLGKITGGGRIVNVGGRIVPQSTAPTVTDPDNTTLVMSNDLWIAFWSFGTWNMPFVSEGCTLKADEGSVNCFGKSTVFNKKTTIDGGDKTGKAINFNGPITINNPTNATAATVLVKIGVGSVYFNGGVTTQFGKRGYYECELQNSSAGTIICTTDVSRTFGAYRSGADGARLWIGGGTFDVLGMLRVANGRSRSTVYQTGGEFFNGQNNDVGHIGESDGSLGAWVMDGGTATFKNSYYIGKWAGSQGIVRQKGGFFQLKKGTAMLGNLGRGELYVLGGTNDFGAANSVATTLEMSRYGGQSTLVVSGEKTVLSTFYLTMGCPTNDETVSTVALKDGATMIAKRFHRMGGKVYVTADNATMKPIVWGGWGNRNYDDAAFTSGAPTKFAILSGGLTIDTSDCYDWDRVKKGNSWSAITYSAPTGKRISKINLPTDSAFAATKYYAPSMVTIKGNGWGASAYAEYDFKNRKLTGIVVTSGGCDYDESTTITLFSPDGKSSYACTYELADNDKGGSLTKRGEQELILSGEQTYTGGTIVEQGSLTFLNYSGVHGIYPPNTPLTVKRGATLNAVGKTLAVSALSGEGKINCNKTTVSEVHVRLADLFGDGHTALNCGGDLEFAEGAKIVVDDPENFSLYKDRKWQTVLTAKSLTGSITFKTPAGVSPEWMPRVKGNSLLFGSVKGLAIILN